MVKAKLGALLHRALAAWLLRVPTRNLCTMPLVALADLPLMIAYSPSRWWTHVLRLRTFRRNLTTRHWPSLADIYPRPLIWTYTYLLFCWGRYCDTLEAMLERPDTCLPAEVFIRYICEIDRHVDGFDSRPVWQSDPHSLKRLPRVRAVAADLCARLNQPDLLTRRAREEIAAYRRDCLRAMRAWADSTSCVLAETIDRKERTAGNLWRVWSRVLGHLYAVPDAVSQHAAQACFDFGMALQIIDDISDAPADDAVGAENIFLAIAREHPAEWACLRRHLDGLSTPFLEWRWVRVHLPQVYHAALQLSDIYTDRLLSDTDHRELTSEMCTVLNRMRTLGG